MQYLSIIFTSLLAAAVSASPAGIDPLTVTSLSPAQVSITPSSSSSSSLSGEIDWIAFTDDVDVVDVDDTLHTIRVGPFTVETPETTMTLTPEPATEATDDAVTSEKRQLARHTTVTAVPRAASDSLTFSPAEYTTRTLSQSGQSESVQVLTYSLLDPTSARVLSPSENVNLTYSLLEATPVTSLSSTPAPSLTKRQQDATDLYTVTTTRLHILSGPVEIYGALSPIKIDDKKVKSPFDIASPAEISVTRTMTYVYKAPPQHIPIIADLASLAFHGHKEVERRRQTTRAPRQSTQSPSWTADEEYWTADEEYEEFNSLVGSSTITLSWWPPFQPFRPTPTLAAASAYASAESAYIVSLTAEPAFTSLIMALATDSSALAAFTSAAAALATISPGEVGGIAEASSLIANLPGPAASFYNSVLSKDIAIASSVVNSGVKDASTAIGSATGASTGGLTKTTTAGGSAANTVTGAAATNAVVKAAGVAIGVFGAAVALL